MIDDIVQLAIKTIESNQECFVAQWILQNPDKNISDYQLTRMEDWANGVFTFEVQEKIKC